MESNIVGIRNQDPSEKNRNEEWRLMQKGIRAGNIPPLALRRNGKVFTLNTPDGQEREIVSIKDLAEEEYEDANQYDFPQDRKPSKKSPLVKGDSTAYHHRYQHWGPKPENRAPILFVFSDKDRETPEYQPGPLLDAKGRIIFNNKGFPIIGWDFPTRIGTRAFGFLLETIMREDSRITWADVMDRMPWNEKGTGVYQMRTLRFRREAHLIAWGNEARREEDWENRIQSQMSDGMKESNTVRGLDDMLRNDILAIEHENVGKKPKWLKRAGNFALSEEEREIRKFATRERMKKSARPVPTVSSSSRSFTIASLAQTHDKLETEPVPAVSSSSSSFTTASLTQTHDELETEPVLALSSSSSSFDVAFSVQTPRDSEQSPKVTSDQRFIEIRDSEMVQSFKDFLSSPGPRKKERLQKKDIASILGESHRQGSQFVPDRLITTYSDDLEIQQAMEIIDFGQFPGG
ncbi:MAG: hypothetical protein M1834_009601 [Cirrosporium novae-zelandiae]|nr:MAG: hypothetical protein M1834_009601 [Cirrosporium novae-zelandiae]